MNINSNTSIITSRKIEKNLHITIFDVDSTQHRKDGVMDKKTVEERIRALVISGENRPDAARLRDVFDVVEMALKAKVPQADVLAELHKNGFTMKLGSFKSALQRIRKERNNVDSGETKKSKILKNPKPDTAEDNAKEDARPIENIAKETILSLEKITQKNDLSLPTEMYERFRTKSSEE